MVNNSRDDNMSLNNKILAPNTRLTLARPKHARSKPTGPMPAQYLAQYNFNASSVISRYDYFLNKKL